MSIYDRDKLILSPRGAIYHLDITPEQLADIIITVGDPQRVPLITQFFSSIEFTNVHREFVITTGEYNGVRLTVLSTGIGTQNIDIVMNELDALVNIDFENRIPLTNTKKISIWRIGTTGSIQEDVAVGSLVVATHGIDFTGVISHYKHKKNPEENTLTNMMRDYLVDDYSTLPVDIFCASNRLVDLFKNNKQYVFGITATCNGFYAAQDRELRAKSNIAGFVKKISGFSYNDIKVTNFEMETGTLYGLGKVFNHECCSVNTVLANRITNVFAENPTDLVVECIKSTLDILVKK